MLETKGAINPLYMTFPSDFPSVSEDRKLLCPEKFAEYYGLQSLKLYVSISFAQVIHCGEVF